jgi:trigger factor
VTLTKEFNRLEKSSAKLSITIGKDDVKSEYEGLLKEYTRAAQLPGFRKGKVPKDVLIRKFGDALKQETLGKIIEKSTEEVFADEAFPRENRPLPYSQPRVQDESDLNFTLDSDFQFSVVYDVLPVVKIEKWEGLEAEVPEISIDDEDLSRELELIRERNSIVLDKDEGDVAASGDVATVNYRELGDEAGGEREDFAFTIGSGNNIYHFDDEVIGMKKGETKEFSKTYPEDFQDRELAGKTKKLKVTLTALKVKKLPELDDDLAQDVDEKFNTLDDLKNNIRERLNKDLERRLKVVKINKLLEKIMENTPVEIPESMLRMELDSRWRNLAHNFNTDARGLFKIMGNSEQNAGSIIEEWKPDAARALHSRLIVETLMEDLKLEASDEEIEKEIERQAEESSAKIDEIKKYYEDERMKEYLKEDIKEHKVFDILLEKNTVKTEKKKKYIDLISNNR